MKSKQTKLTIEQVNNNLSSLFPGKPIACIKADTHTYKPYENSNYTAEYFYYIIETPKLKLAIGEDKRVWAAFPEDVILSYETEREIFNIPHKVIEIFGETYTEFICDKTDKRENAKEAKAQAELLLIAVGYKKAKQAETTEQKLRRLMGANYENFYKIVKDVKVTGYEFKQGVDRYGRLANFDVLKIHHLTGSFSFPITALNGNNYDGSMDTDVQDIFCDLLGIKNPYTLAAIEEIKVAA